MRDSGLKNILRNWDLVVDDIQPLSGNVANEIWSVVVDNTSYILKREAYWKSKDQILFELGFLRLLGLASFPYYIPRPMTSKDNEEHVMTGDAIYWLYPKLHGNIISNLDISHIQQIGNLIGAFHEFLLDYHPEVKHRGDLLNRKQLLEEIEQYSLLEGFQDHPLLDQCKSYLQILQPIEIPDLPQYAIHRDIRPDNLLWDSDRLSGILDFENVSDVGDCLVKDIAVALQGIALSMGDLDQQIIDAIIDGYSDNLPLLRMERRLIPYLMLSGIIEDILYQFWLVEEEVSENLPDLSAEIALAETVIDKWIRT